MVLFALLSLSFATSVLAFEPDQALIQCDRPFSQEFSFEKLQSAIEQCKLGSVEEVLPLLPEDLKANYTLVYQSRSLQEANYDHPRAILYGKNSNTIVTFNGDPKQKGYHQLEVMEFKPETKKFEFREITFHPGAPGAARVSFSQKNPAACLACHGENPRPIWDSYFLWPGVYGSQDDQMPDLRRADGNPDPASEASRFRKFWSTHEQNPRYQVLLPRYRARDTDEGYDNLTQAPADRPNEGLNIKLKRMNLAKLVRDISSDRRLKSLRYALLEVVYCRRSVEDVLTPELVALMQRDPGEIRAETKRLQAQSILDRAERLPQGPTEERTITAVKAGKSRPAPDYYVDSFVGDLRGLVEAFGFSFAQETMEFPKSYFTFNDGVGGIDSYLPMILWKELLDPKVDRDFVTAFEHSARINETDYSAPRLQFLLENCGKIHYKNQALLKKKRGEIKALMRKAQSRNETCKPSSEESPLKAETLKTIRSVEKSIQEIANPFGPCLSCHGGSVESIPFLPFENLDQTKGRLKDSGYPRGTLKDEILYRLKTRTEERMPMNRELDESEVNEIQKFLDETK